MKNIKYNRDRKMYNLYSPLPLSYLISTDFTYTIEIDWNLQRILHNGKWMRKESSIAIFFLQNFELREYYKKYALRLKKDFK